MSGQQKCGSNQLSTSLTSISAGIDALQLSMSKGTGISRVSALTGSLMPLPAEACKSVTLINSTVAPVVFICNGGSQVALPINSGITLYVSNVSLISVKGSGELSYIINN